MKQNIMENIKFKSKQEIREKIWKLLEEKNIADFPRPCYGRIPNFVGSIQAAEKIKLLVEFKESKYIFCTPDYVLKRVREIVLEEGKILIVALPHMKDFVQIKEYKNISESVNIKGFLKYGKPLDENIKIGLFVQGSVAVDIKGNRLGKGKGYGDKEWEYLFKKGMLTNDTKIVTIVHSLQIVNNFSHLVNPNDKKVDYIITEKEIIKIGV